MMRRTGLFLIAAVALWCAATPLEAACAGTSLIATISLSYVTE